MGAAINHACNSEQERADYAMRKHLQDGTRNAQRIGRAQSEQNKAHVTHTGVADNEFQIALPQGNSCSVDDADDGESSDPVAPHLESLREKVHRHPQPGVRAEFHDDTSEQHRTRSWRGDVTGRRPSMQWPDTGEDSESEKQHRESPRL